MIRAGLASRRCGPRRPSAATSRRAASRSPSTRRSRPGRVAARAAARGRRPARRQPLLHPADGGLGRHARTGEPSELTVRRWRHFGRSGAKLIWGGEAVAVRHDGRANPQPARDRRRDTLPALARAARDARRRARASASAPGRRRPRRRPAAHPLGPLLAARRQGPARAARRLRTIPCSTAAFPGGVRLLHRRRARRAGRRLRRRGAAARASAGFPSSTSSTATATSATSCSRARDRAGPLRRLASRTARASCARSSTGIRAEAPGLRDRRAPLGLRHACRTARTPTASGVPEADAGRLRATAFGCSTTSDLDAGARPTRASCSRLLEALGMRWVCMTAGSPYYNPHVQRPGALPAERRLPAARGSARSAWRGRSRRPRGSRPRSPTSSSSARPTATCRSGCRTSAQRVRARRAGPTSSASAAWCCPIPSCRPTCSRARPLDAQAHLPHLQRLHDRAAQRPASRAATRSIPSTRSGPRPRALKAGQGGAARVMPSARRGRPTRPRRPGAGRRRRPSSSLFSIVGFALYGLPFFYDFFVSDLGWTRQQVTSGNAYSKLVVGAAVRLPRRAGRRPLRPAPADARRHPDGRRRARRPRPASSTLGGSSTSSTS